ncbi:MAG: ABC transporter ATP-binding protein, partial [Nocardiopsaceae bacterium]|nr:ABC transporter ATP-binding protein [Nocardiopsaceae bacterium]
MTSDGLLVEGLCVSYRRFGRRLPVLFDVDLAVAPGEALGVVGESGCGKSTLALAIVRFLPSNGGVESGRVCIGGRDVLNLDREQLRELRGRHVGMVYQDPGAALNPALRIGEQVAEVFRTHEKCSKHEATERAVEMLERVYLPGGVKMLRRYPHQLSGGQQQRVVIAMALAGNPDVLILDEPTTGLDATVEAEVLDLVSELRRQYQTALLFISHNLAVVGQVCERVAVLYAGRVVETGAASEIFRRPRHPYTHGLLGCVPRVGATKRANRLESIPGSLPVLGSLVSGCQFSPRCVLADDACRQEEPELVPVGGTEMSRCLRAAQVPEPDQPLVATGRSAPPAGLGEPGEAPAPEPLPAGEALPAGESALLSTAPAVKVEALRKVFPGGVVACDAVSLEIARGETVGLVGESGSGKSTLARCIAGLTVADEGEIWVDGSAVRMRLARRTEPQRRSVQMVFQNPDTTLNPRHSVSYVLRRAVRKLGGRTDAESLAKQTGIGPAQLAVRAGQLSGGQRQR